MHLFGFTIEIAHTRSADKSLEDQEGNKLQRPNSNFCKPLKKNSEVCPSNEVFAAGMASASDENWGPFNCFFQSGRAKDLSAPLMFLNLPYFVWLLIAICVFLRATSFMGRDQMCLVFDIHNLCYLTTFSANHAF